MTDPELHAITITWDLDEGTGLSVRYGDMPPGRAAMLLELAGRLVSEHSDLLEEIAEEEELIEYLDDIDKHDNDDDELDQ